MGMIGWRVRFRLRIIQKLMLQPINMHTYLDLVALQARQTGPYEVEEVHHATVRQQTIQEDYHT